MNGDELIRLVDAIHREKDISRESLFEALEAALLTAVKKKYGEREDLAIEIDRRTGEIIAWEGDEEAEDIDLSELGRIAAQTARQVMMQKIRDAERDVIYEDFEDKVGQIVGGQVSRIERGNVIVSLGRAEGIIPRTEKVRTENYNPGDRVKALIYDVKKVGGKVSILLTRSSPEFVRKLFHAEVPEIQEGSVEIKGIAREPGFRTKIAVHSVDGRVDCIGACVGIRGSRIRSITDELNGEKIDIVRWSPNIEEFLLAALGRAVPSSIEFDHENRVARVIVPDDQLALAIGRRGQNVRLASELTGYEVQIESPVQAASEGDEEVDRAQEALLSEEPSASAEAEGEASGEESEGAAESAPVAVADEPSDAEERVEAADSTPSAAPESGDVEGGGREA